MNSQPGIPEVTQISDDSSTNKDLKAEVNQGHWASVRITETKIDQNQTGFFNELNSDYKVSKLSPRPHDGISQNMRPMKESYQSLRIELPLHLILLDNFHSECVVTTVRTRTQEGSASNKREKVSMQGMVINMMTTSQRSLLTLSKGRGGTIATI